MRLGADHDAIALGNLRCGFRTQAERVHLHNLASPHPSMSLIIAPALTDLGERACTTDTLHLLVTTASTESTGKSAPTLHSDESRCHARQARPPRLHLDCDASDETSLFNARLPRKECLPVCKMPPE